MREVSHKHFEHGSHVPIGIASTVMLDLGARKRPRENSVVASFNEGTIPTGSQRFATGADPGVLGDGHLGGDSSLYGVGELGYGSDDILMTCSMAKAVYTKE